MDLGAVTEIATICTILAVAFFFFGGWPAVLGVVGGWTVGMMIVVLLWKFVFKSFLT